jgi:hypothetical protein
MTPASDEIAKIEHELEILRSRYSIFERWAKITRWYVIGAAVIASSALVGYAFFHDPLVGAFAAVIVMIIGGLLCLARDNDIRWIDVVSWWPWGRIYNIGPKSEAVAIETMIAEREARLIAVSRQRDRNP